MSKDQQGPQEILSVHTLNARDNVMLEVMRSYFKITPDRMLHEIQAMRRDVERMLALKGIKYDALRSALVPDQTRTEIALIFDIPRVGDNWYGYRVFERIIPLLAHDSNHSILCGDYLERGRDRDILFKAMRDAASFIQPVEFRYAQQFFIVYINNLTSAMVEKILAGLAEWHPFVGHADTTFESHFKHVLSTMLVNVCVKHGRSIIQGHEDDRPDTDDVNMCGYPFEESGYVCRSIRGDFEGLFLSYKIERPVFDGFREDTEFSINAVSHQPMPLNEFAIEVDEAKLAYLKSAKSGSIARANLESVTPEQLSAIIKDRIDQSYIYNMAAEEAYDLIKFNIIVELKASAAAGPTRLMAALKYRPDDRSLKLITLY